MNVRWFLFILLLVAAGIGVAASYSVEPRWLVYLLSGLLIILLLLSWLFYRRILRPIHTINLGADLLRGRDFSSRLAPVGQPDLDGVIDLFNAMMLSLRAERLNKQEQDRLLDRVLDVSPLGIIMVDDADCITLLNPAARTILSPDNPSVAVGQPLADLKGEVARALIPLQRNEAVELRLGDSSIFRLSRHGFMDRGFEHPFYIIESLTDEIRRAERRSYGKVIRVMSHEVNNLMAGVTSTIDTITPIMAEIDTDISESLRSCSERCRETSSFIGRLAEAVKIPAPSISEVDVPSLIRNMLPMLQSLCSPRGVEFESDLPDAPVIIPLDPVLMEQVVVNIVKNAAESASAVSSPLVTLALSSGAPTLLTVTDNGPGITPEVSRQLFTPFFTTRPDGHGIGLTLVSEILSSHRFTFSLSTPAPSRTVFSIRLR